MTLRFEQRAPFSTSSPKLSRAR